MNTKLTTTFTEAFYTMIKHRKWLHKSVIKDSEKAFKQQKLFILTKQSNRNVFSNTFR